MASQTILIIEDESDIRELIALTLASAGYTAVEQAPDGETGLQLAKLIKPDLILLDWMLPGMDGLDVCRQIKQDPELAKIPIVMLTAKSEELDIVLGLEMGAVDYMTKPFSNKVLVARIRAHLRTATPQEASPSTLITYAGIALDPAFHTLTIRGLDVTLTAGEFATLLLLISHPGRVYTRNQIINAVKGEAYAVTDRAVDVQIVGLRKKLDTYGEMIETVRGVGYKMKAL